MRPIIFLKTAIVLFCLHIQAAKAQVCNGSLGDPVVNVNFGSGSNPGSSLQSATTTYSFTFSNCPNDGSYTVVNSTAGCFGNSWHTVPEDHTPNDANGYMMLVNASVTPGDFYVDTVKNLCANTTYEFAAWIINVLLPGSCSPNPILPKLVFNIETTAGIVLGTYSTGDIPAASDPTWKQYGLFFTTPANTNDVVIRLTNEAPGGCGNDVALDDITFRACGPTVLLSGSSNQTSFDLCSGTPANIMLTATIGNGYSSPTYQWQESIDNGLNWSFIAGANTTSYLFNKSNKGAYQYRLLVADGTNILITSCRVASNVITLTLHDKPVVSASNNGPFCENTPATLAASGGATYSWTGPGGFTSTLSTPSFIAISNAAGQYDVIVTDQYGCTNTSSTVVAVNPQPVATVSSDISFCEGGSATLNAGGGNAYLWSPATGLSDVASPSPVASPADTTTYRVIVTSANNCADTATVTVNILKKPVAHAGQDKLLLKGQSVVLDGIVTGSDVDYSWSPSLFLDNALLLTPRTTPPSDILYTLTAFSNVGCGISTDDVFVNVYNDIFIPKAFSPNNDGLNDTWHIEALGVFPNAKVIVYNRYGQVVFESTAATKDWDGTFKNTALATGAYAYVLDLKNNLPIRKGMVMIVR